MSEEIRNAVTGCSGVRKINPITSIDIKFKYTLINLKFTLNKKTKEDDNNKLDRLRPWQLAAVAIVCWLGEGMVR